MNILYFSYVDLDRPSACQTHTLGILGGFAANGCQVDAIVPRPSVHRPHRELIRFHFLSPYHGGRDAAALAAIILRLQQNPAEAARIAQSLRCYVMNRLTWKAVASDILAVMEKSWKPPIAK
jgi:hypothetical protein